MRDGTLLKGLSVFTYISIYKKYMNNKKADKSFIFYNNQQLTHVIDNCCEDFTRPVSLGNSFQLTQ